MRAAEGDLIERRPGPQPLIAERGSRFLFDAFSQREPVSTSLENALIARSDRFRGLYSAALRISARSARTAQNLNSGILPNGSSAGLVSRFAAASA